MKRIGYVSCVNWWTGVTATAVVHVRLDGMRIGVPILLLLALTGCSPEPRPIRYGEDVCENCRMQLIDRRFGAELVLETGRVLVFDAVECMASYEAAGNTTAPVHSRWVTDFDGAELMRTGKAIILRSRLIQSPMSQGLAAFGSTSPPDSLIREYGGETLVWEAVVHLASTGWPTPAGAIRDPQEGGP